MSWDGARGGWVPPAEAKAAEEAAEKFARERAAADARTQIISDAIAFGLDRVAMAIVAAAGDDAVRRFERVISGCTDGDCGLLGALPADPGADYTPVADPDIDDLLDDDSDDDPDADPLG